MISSISGTPGTQAAGHGRLSCPDQQRCTPTQPVRFGRWADGITALPEPAAPPGGWLPASSICRAELGPDRLPGAGDWGVPWGRPGVGHLHHLWGWRRPGTCHQPNRPCRREAGRPVTSMGVWAGCSVGFAKGHAACCTAWACQWSSVRSSAQVEGEGEGRAVQCWG